MCKRLGTEYSFSVNANESEYSKTGEPGDIYESGRNSSSVNLVLETEVKGRTVSYGPSFFPIEIYPSAKRGNQRGIVTYSTNRQGELSKMLPISLLCV